jgi:hypothetical protein
VGVVEAVSVTLFLACHMYHPAKLTIPIMTRNNKASNEVKPLWFLCMPEL